MVINAGCAAHDQQSLQGTSNEQHGPVRFLIDDKRLTTTQDRMRIRQYYLTTERWKCTLTQADPRRCHTRVSSNRDVLIAGPLTVSQGAKRLVR
jgi:hypothetical protein